MGNTSLGFGCSLPWGYGETDGRIRVCVWPRQLGDWRLALNPRTRNMRNGSLFVRIFHARSSETSNVPFSPRFCGGTGPHGPLSKSAPGWDNALQIIHTMPTPLCNILSTDNPICIVHSYSYNIINALHPSLTKKKIPHNDCAAA